jgi:hypothetical protein
MDLAIHGGISPEDIIAFIQEHTEEYSAMVKTEMQGAQDRADLVKDIASLCATLQRAKLGPDTPANMERAKQAHDELVAFAEKHPEVPVDLKAMTANTGAWATNASISWDSADHHTEEGVDVKMANDDLDCAINDLSNYKDKVNGDDKIGMMTLQEDASRMKELYELGSNLLAKGDQTSNVLINNIKG